MPRLSFLAAAAVAGAAAETNCPVAACQTANNSGAGVNTAGRYSSALDVIFPWKLPPATRTVPSGNRIALSQMASEIRYFHRSFRAAACERLARLRRAYIKPTPSF